MNMWPLRLIAKEILHRKANAALAVLSTAAAVALCTALYTAMDASRRETTRIQRDIGFNLRILPEARVLQIRAIADARARQRQMAERLFAAITPLDRPRIEGIFFPLKNIPPIGEDRVPLWKARGPKGP